MYPASPATFLKLQMLEALTQQLHLLGIYPTDEMPHVQSDCAVSHGCLFFNSTRLEAT